MSGMLKIAVYCRVSSDEQRHKGNIERQLQSAPVDLRRLRLLTEDGGPYALYPRISGAQGPKSTFFVDDGYNLESLPESTALHELLELIRSGEINAIYVDSPDRIFRSRRGEIRGKIGDIIDQHEVKIFDNRGEIPDGVLRDVISAFGAEDKRSTNRKLHLGRMIHARTYKTPPSGRAFFGYCWNGKSKTWTIVEDEARVVRWVVALAAGQTLSDMPLPLQGVTESARDGASDAQIIAALEEQGVSLLPYYQRCQARYIAKNPTGKIPEDWITNLFRDDRYTGKHSFFFKDERLVGRRKVDISQKTRIDIELPPIVSKDRWEQAKASRERRAAYHGRHSKQEYLLEKMLFCSECGKPMSARPRHVEKYVRAVRGPKTYTSLYYVCKRVRTQQSPRCKAVRCHNAKVVEPLVWEQVRALVLGNDFILENGRAVRQDQAQNKTLKNLRVQFEDISKQLREIDQERARLVGALAKGLIAESEFQTFRIERARDKERLEKLTSRLLREIRQTERSIRDERSLDLDRIRKLYAHRVDALPFKDRQALVRAVVQRVTVSPDRELEIEFPKPNSAPC